jgi:2-phosphoglycerate kinase
MSELQTAQVYMIGGMPRTGKTTLAKRVARAVDGELVRTDTLRVMFGGDPLSLIRYGASPSIKPAARAFRPFLNALITSGHAEPLIVEGELLRVKTVAQLAQIRPVSACFLGLNDADAAYARISANHTPADWTYDLDGAELLSVLSKYAKRSDHVRRDCEEHGVPYYDVSKNILEMHERAYRLLVSIGETALSDETQTA